MRPPPALLLLCLPGCLALTGPGFVIGTEGSSLQVQCQYEQGYKGYNKYWCRGQYDKDCKSIVETKGGEEEERSGRVSIRDSADDLTLTVTIENLSPEDAGSYWCKIQIIFITDIFWPDASVLVEVHVSPATPTPMKSTRLPSTVPMVTLGQNVSIGAVSTHHQHLWALLSNIHLLFLIFLKLPLLLSLLGAVLWVNRPLRAPGRRSALSRGHRQKALCKDVALHIA